MGDCDDVGGKRGRNLIHGYVEGVVIRGLFLSPEDVRSMEKKKNKRKKGGIDLRTKTRNRVVKENVGFCSVYNLS